MGIKVEGKCGISAEVLKHSKSSVDGTEILTFEIAYPRLIMCEINTHRMLSKNSASSRAIPFNKMVENLTGEPVRFGQANPGMQDKGEDYKEIVYTPDWENIGGEGEDAVWMPVMGTSGPLLAWEAAKEHAIAVSRGFYEAGYHKQVYNRLTEPFQMMKTVITATEWANFFWLRDDDAADPTLRELARCMREAQEQSEPQVLHPGEWHLPYVHSVRDWTTEELHYHIDHPEEDGYIELAVEDAIAVSCARSAAVSFRNVDYGVEKSREVYNRLVTDQRVHGSAMEHAATPRHWFRPGTEDHAAINDPWYPRSWEKGVTHMDRDFKLWSGNFKGFIQYRKLINGENKPGFKL